MIKYLAKYLQDFIKKGGSYIPPESSGKDGYLLMINDVSVFLSNYDIGVAENAARILRLGFIKKDILWYHPDSENLRYLEFSVTLNSILKNKLQY